MQKIIDDLHKEHDDFKTMLDFLLLQLELQARSEDINYDLMYDILYYLIHYPQQFHHAKEDLLYQRVIELDPSMELFNNLKDEHRVLVARNLAYFETIKNILGSTAQSLVEFQSSANKFIKYQLDHIINEEQNIFPIIEDRFSNEDWAVVDKRYLLLLKDMPDFDSEYNCRKSLLNHIKDNELIETH